MFSIYFIFKQQNISENLELFCNTFYVHVLKRRCIDLWQWTVENISLLSTRSENSVTLRHAGEISVKHGAGE